MITPNTDSAKKFLTSVRADESVGKAIGSQILTASKKQGHSLVQCAERLGVMRQYLDELQKGARDLSGAEVSLLQRIANYLNVDCGVMQIAVGNLTISDFTADSKLSPIHVVSKQAATWLRAEYARSLVRLAADYGYEKVGNPLSVACSLERVEKAAAEESWLNVSEQRITERKDEELLNWLVAAGRERSCTLEGFSRFISVLPRTTYELFNGHQPLHGMGYVEVRRIALYLAIPAAAVFAAGGYLGQKV